jgi:NADH:ubiquinone oxidoreductase subunit C
MQRDELVEKITKDLEGKLENTERPSGKRAYLYVHPDNSLEINRYLYELGGRLATATGVDSRDYIEVLYHYSFDAMNIIVTVKTRAFKPDVEIDSVAQLFQGAEWIEREIHDLLGVKFKNHPRLERLILSDDWEEGVYPLRRDYKK